MPFEIVRNDITQMTVDAIVNTANPRPVIGAGVDSMIHKKAGPELLRAREKIGPISVGSAAITRAYRLHAKYVIHTVGPVWNGGGDGEEPLLRSCYDHSLKLAVKHHCRSIAFPLISTGNYGFPKDLALQVAISAFSTFLMECEMQIYLVVFDQTSFKLSEKLFQNVSSYIDEHYVGLRAAVSYSLPVESSPQIRRRNMEQQKNLPVGNPMPPCAPMPRAASLKDLLKKTDAGFTETLLKLIDKSGKKDSEIYKKANISKQHFSKIRNNPNYKPSKATALAFAIALELDLAQTKDLIGRAGYALTNSSKQDLIVKFFIEQRNFNIVQINIALYEFDQGLLGSA